MKRLFRLISLICILGLLAGCGMFQEALQQLEPDSPLGLSTEAPSSAQLEFHAALYTDGEPAMLWGREQLSVHAQRAYDSICQAIAARQDTPVEVDLTEEEIDLVLAAIRIDHPEYFWFDGKASFVTTSVAGVTVKTECTLSYIMDLPEIQPAHDAIRQYTAECLSALAAAGAETDYEKILGVYRYIIENTDYLMDDTDQTILGVMRDHQGTCAGYARAFQYLMSQLDIPCTLALGEGASGEAHGWNIVRCGDGWYQMDVTWGDPVLPDDAPGDSIQYTYCMLTDAEIFRDHALISPIRMPTCTATEYNYYVQAGRQFDLWDPEAYAEAMTTAVAAGEEWFSVRFSDAAGYDRACEALFQEEAIWEILRQSGAATAEYTTITYTQNDLFYEISVRLEGDSEGA